MNCDVCYEKPGVVPVETSGEKEMWCGRCFNREIGFVRSTDTMRLVTDYSREFALMGKEQEEDNGSN